MKTPIRRPTSAREQRIREVVARLVVWKDLYDKINHAQNELSRLTGADADTVLTGPMWQVWSAYTTNLSELCGDNNEWLDWYQYQCDMGKRPSEVDGLKGRKFPLKVKTLRHLALVICDV
jgi:hypothetical protein